MKIANKVNILGTEYKIECHKISEDKVLETNSWSGYCDEEQKLIVYADMNDNIHYTFDNDYSREVYAKKLLRHEITHAFLNESGLTDSANRYEFAWSRNEEMVDWIAIQFPKMLTAFKEVGCI